MSVRHDWYQTEAKIVITVLLKNAVDKNYLVKIDEEKVEMTADGYHLELNLFRPIVVEKSSYKATPSKVEISLAKQTGERWENLDRKLEAQTGEAALTKKPHNDWDKLAKEIQEKETEEAKEEEALNNLFKKIYSESSEEVRRAMNKSFMESGGTVLSTNWNEVGAKQVEIKPPDGTEYKEWNGSN